MKWEFRYPLYIRGICHTYTAAVGEDLPRASADGCRQRLNRGKGTLSAPCLFANVNEAFVHRRRVPEHLYPVVWVERIVIIRRFTGFTRAVFAISSECAPVQVAHGVAEKLSPLLLLFFIPTVVRAVVASKSQHECFFDDALSLSLRCFLTAASSHSYY
jgi:hypothetical protein